MNPIFSFPHRFFKLISLMFIFALPCISSDFADTANRPLWKVGEFAQEVSVKYSQADGVPDGEIHSIEVHPSGDIYVGTQEGAWVFHDPIWKRVEGIPMQPVLALYGVDDRILAVVGQGLYEITTMSAKKITDIPDSQINGLYADSQTTWIATNEGLYRWSDHQWKRDEQVYSLLGEDKNVNAVACSKEGTLAIAADAGLLLKKSDQTWEFLYPESKDRRSWALRDVASVVFDHQDRLWFASPQGVGCYGSDWNLYTGQDGLPANDFTCMTSGEDGAMWFGTRTGAIRFDGKHWEYRQGKRWIPGDEIRDVAVTRDGHAWIATSEGIGKIERRPMTLKQKADFYEEEIEKYIKRTEYGYLSEVGLKRPGDKSEIVYSDSDNDGLWTSMYGAGECFAYAATRDPKAKARAKQAFEALRFLSTAPVGGEVKQQPGFVARTVLPTSEANPNERPGYTLEGMKRKRESEDGRWKVYFPRWPLTEDGKYWYKTDTSSDELDGHYFFYALYFDLVADTQEEKERVCEVVKNITDHLIRNDYCLVDHDGTPTRWGVYRPSILNFDFAWYAERGLNSLSMLSYLAVAEHVTGDPKYGEASRTLIDRHSYHLNAMVTKLQRGIGSGNQSDDEMAFMSYYNLIRHTSDEALRNQILFSFFNAWILEFPEMNPFFNFAYAACGYRKTFTDPWGTYDLSPWDGWLEDSVETLTGFPLDRVNWSHTNSHRLDIVRLPRHAGINPEDDDSRARGYRVNGKVLPVQERHFNHWNTDPWALDIGGNGQELANGTVYLLPYYMGLYYGFVE